MKRKIFFITSFMVLFDQIIKYIVSYNEVNLVLIPNLISFLYTKNDGVAFSILSGNRVFIILLSVLLIFVMGLFMIKDIKKYPLSTDFIWTGYALLFGGIIGNLVDRLFRGYVVDFISLNIVGYPFPVFNIADLCITIGVVILVIKYLKEEKKMK